MELADKIVEALSPFRPELVRLDAGEDAISGIVVSTEFRGHDGMRRQEKIEDCLRVSLSPEERRRILMIAAMTPEEYAHVGVKIRVHRIERVGPDVELLFHGTRDDADYVRTSLRRIGDVWTSEPKPVRGALGVLMKLLVHRADGKDLSDDEVQAALEQDRFISLALNN